MKFVRFGNDKPLPGVLDPQNRVRDLSSAMTDFDFEKETPIDATRFPIVGHVNDVHLFPPLPRPGKLICLAYNSKTHTEQMKQEMPTEPFFFFKATSALVGARDPIVYPKIGKKIDWEAELCVVIGKRGKHIAKERALEHVFGYCLMNDLSDRHWQAMPPARQHAKAKSFDTFAPMGPYLVTKDEIPDPDRLHFVLKVNGAVRQDFWTSEYEYDVATAIAYLSDFFSLEPGDAISMGSGPGNAGFWNNQFLRVGDTVEFSCPELGGQRQTVIAEHG